MSIGSKFRGLKRNLGSTKQGMNQADKGSRKQYQKDVAADVAMGAADTAIMSTMAGQLYTGATGKTFSDSVGYESKTALGNSIDVYTDTTASNMAIAAPIAAGVTVGVATGNPMLGVQTYQGVRGVQKMTGAYDEREGNNSLINMGQADQALGFVDAAAPMVGSMGGMGGGGGGGEAPLLCHKIMQHRWKVVSASNFSVPERIPQFWRTSVWDGMRYGKYECVRV